MAFYLALMFYCVFVSQFMADKPYVSRKNSASLYRRRIVSFVSIAAFYVFVVGFRYNVGADWPTYYETYSTLKSFGKYILDDPDIGFYWLNAFAAHWNLGFYFVLGTVAFLTVYYLIRAVSYTSFLLPFYFFFFFTVIFNESLNVMRQILAYFALYYAVVLFLNRRFRRGAIVFLIAWSFHKSALFAVTYLPFLYYHPFKNCKLNIIMVLTGFLLGEILYEYFKELIFAYSALLSGSRFGGAISESGFGYFEYIAVDWNAQIAKYVHLAITIAIIWMTPTMQRLYRNFYYDFFFSLFMVGQILQPILIWHSMFQRLNYYFYLYTILFLAFLCYSLWHYKVTRFGFFCQRSIVIGICLIHLVLHIKHIIQGTAFLPYKNYILDIMK